MMNVADRCIEQLKRFLYDKHAEFDTASEPEGAVILALDH